ncbi:MAG: Rho termination factor N-terminal domain-containing protein [Clostridia bacterium]|jgi:hypothetical protein
MGKKIMEISVIDLQVVHHMKILDARKQSRLLETDLFVEAWTKASPKERLKIIKLLHKVKPKSLKTWIIKSLFDIVDLSTLTRLRQLASQYKIKNYSRKTRWQLVNEIKERQTNDSIGRPD